MEKIIIRMLTCRSCAHSGEPDNPYRHKKCYCNKTKRTGNLSRGYCCEKFEFRQLDKPVADDGLYVKNRMPQDYRTASQWYEVGREVKNGEIGIEMHPNRTTLRTYIYFLPEQTEKIKR